MLMETDRRLISAIPRPEGPAGAERTAGQVFLISGVSQDVSWRPTRGPFRRANWGHGAMVDGARVDARQGSQLATKRIVTGRVETLSGAK